jgi:hypothetical protein
VAALFIACAACAGDGRAPATRPVAPTLDRKTPPNPPTVRMGEVEVTGIVGSVDAGARSITINRLSGANARTITVDDRTIIRRAAGGSLTLARIRPSDRIIATGVLEAATDSLLAREIEVGAIGDPGAGG